MAVDQDNGQVDPLVPESYEHLLEDYSQFAPPAADEVVQGTVLGITAKDVIIDFGYKSEGIVPIDQFQSPTGEVTVKRGDVVDVMIDRSEHVEGGVPVSARRYSDFSCLTDCVTCAPGFLMNCASSKIAARNANFCSSSKSRRSSA